MITGNIIARVLHVRCDDQQATAFAYDFEGRQYLVSARHVLKGFHPTRRPLLIMRHGDWKVLPAKLVGHAEGDVDVSVLAAADDAVRSEGEVFLNSLETTYGETLYFMGFPHGLFGDMGEFLDGFPLPFVKRATLAGMNFAGGAFWLDGINNAGFSGGPVLRPQPNNQFAMVAVISGYQTADRKVLHKGNDTGLQVPENTGLITAWSVRHAVDLMKANPIGFEL